jgi:biotin transport system substrate-specific component
MTSKTNALVTAGLLTALTAIGALIRVPTPLVPFTMQTFFTFLAGCILQPNLAALSQLAYLILGLAGLPIFSQGGGMGYIFQPTFGYLLGLPAAAYLIASLGVRFPGSYAGLFLRNCAGILVIYIFGVTWLYLFANYGPGVPLTLEDSIYTGAVLFLPIDVLKALSAAFVAKILKARLDSSRGSHRNPVVGSD